MQKQLSKFSVLTSLVALTVLIGCAKPDAKDAGTANQSGDRAVASLFDTLSDGDAIIGVASSSSFHGIRGADANSSTVVPSELEASLKAIPGNENSSLNTSDPEVAKAVAFLNLLPADDQQFFARGNPGLFMPNQGGQVFRPGQAAGMGWQPLGGNGLACMPSQGHPVGCHLLTMGGVCDSRWLNLLAADCIHPIKIWVFIPGNMPFPWKEIFNFRWDGPGTNTVTVFGNLPAGTTGWSWGGTIDNTPRCNCL